MSTHFQQHLQAILPQLTEADFAHIQRFFKPIQRRRHQYLVQEGEAVRYDYWVISGAVKSYYLDEKGREHILQFAFENWWVTDYDAYFNQQAATLHIDCLEDCQLLAITLEQREQLCREVPMMEHFWRLKIQKGFISLQRRILTLLRLPAEERYRQLLHTFPDLPQRVPKKLIAAYLGLSRETLSRLTL